LRRPLDPGLGVLSKLFYRSDQLCASIAGARRHPTRSASVTHQRATLTLCKTISTIILRWAVNEPDLSTVEAAYRDDSAQLANRNAGYTAALAR
jgi:hypothetical protein